MVDVWSSAKGLLADGTAVALVFAHSLNVFVSEAVKGTEVVLTSRCRCPCAAFVRLQIAALRFSLFLSPIGCRPLLRFAEAAPLTVLC